MDAERLFRILQDLQRDENELTIAAKIEAIHTNVAQNNETSFQSSQDQLQELISTIKDKSISYKFSRPEDLLLEKIGGYKFYGQGLIGELEKIFALMPIEISTNLTQYKNQRNDFISKITKLAVAFSEAGIKEYKPESYEVSIILPEQQGDFEEISKRIKDLKKLICAFAEGAGTPIKDIKEIKITRLSNGSLELFVLLPLNVAVLLTTLFLNISSIYEKIGRFKKKISVNENDKDLSVETRETIHKAISQEADKIKEEIIEKLPEEIIKKPDFKLKDEGRKNEIRIAIKGCVRAVFAWFELGIEVDITPLRPSNEGEENIKEMKDFNNFKETSLKLREIYKLPLEIRKLPFKLPPPPPEKKKGKKKNLE